MFKVDRMFGFTLLAFWLDLAGSGHSAQSHARIDPFHEAINFGLETNFTFQRHRIERKTVRSFKAVRDHSFFRSGGGPEEFRPGRFIN